MISVIQILQKFPVEHTIVFILILNETKQSCLNEISKY